MAHRLSAVKKLRQDKKRRIHNLKSKLTIKKAIRKFQDALKEKTDDAKAALKETFSLLDKAVKKGLIHKNTAARKKSRLSRLLNTKKPA